VSEPILPPAPPPQLGPLDASGSPPAKRFTWKHGCVLSLAGLLLSGGSFFVCLASPNSMNNALAPAMVLAFLLGLLLCCAGGVLALVHALLRR
jgi:hypothetical protein